MKGKLIKKANTWWVKTSSEESGDIPIVDYPLSITSKYYLGDSLEDGLEVDFQIEIAIVNGVRFDWAVIQPKVSRVEIISGSKGRLHYYSGDVELSFQDLGKTLKIFVK